jgi:hypothetical protein
MTRSFTSLALLGLLLVIAKDAAACSCATSSPCAGFSTSPVVFVGKVISIDEEFAQIVYTGRGEKDKVARVRTALTARVEIQRIYKGMPSNQRIITIVTGGGGGDCGYDFRMGETYLVLGGSVAQGIYTTNICSGTRPMSEASDYLEVIDAGNRGQPEARLFGRVHLLSPRFGQPTWEPIDSKPLPGIRVEARSSRGVYSAVSDGSGRFRMKNIPEGTYEVRPILLPTQSGFLGIDEKRTVELKLPRQCAAELSFSVQVNGVIRGRLFDSNGRPAGQGIEVSLLRADSVTKLRSDFVRTSEFTEKDGTYEFKGLPPGKYILGFIGPPSWRSPYMDVYYATAFKTADAQVLTLGEGQKLSDINLRLPPPLNMISVRGVVLDRTGKPAADASIDILDLETGDGVDTPPESWHTSSNGSFAIRVPKGRKYSVTAVKDRFDENGRKSESIVITADDRLAQITLKLTKPLEGKDR